MMRIYNLNEGGKSLAKINQWIVPLLVVLIISAFFAFNGSSGTRVHAAGTTTTIWLQTLDSCRQAIPGAKWKLTGHGLNITKGPGPGTGPVTVGSGNCPLQRGNCSTVSTGCLSWNIAVPASGSVTYKIKETRTPNGYVPCNGGSVCPGGPEVVTLNISSSGAVSATTFNVYPDGTSVTYPTSGAPYTGVKTDPILTHNFQLGKGSCDGDNDADDRLTGSPSSHCDSDSDHH